MSLIYALIAQGTKVLCDYSSYSGNFDQLCNSILKKMQTNEQGSYDYEKTYKFYFVNHDGMNYITMCEADYPGETAMDFLESVRKEFESANGTNFDTTPAYSLNTSFQAKLSMKIDYYNKNKDTRTDNIGKLKDEVINVRDQLLKDDELLNQRGEKIQLIVQKADMLSQHSDNYYIKANSVKNKYLCQKIKYTLIVVGIVLVLIYLIVSLVCGFTFKDCGGKD